MLDVHSRNAVWRAYRFVAAAILLLARNRVGLWHSLWSGLRKSLSRRVNLRPSLIESAQLEAEQFCLTFEAIARRVMCSTVLMRDVLDQVRRRSSIGYRSAVFAAVFPIVISGCDVAIAGSPMAIDGQFNVTRVGGATYAIPIVVPPGTAEVVPRLSLTYSSQSGNGLLGVGWTLDGLPSITRCGQTIVQDGKAAGVAFTSADRFCFAGQRLVAASSNYGADGTTYTLELENFSKIVSHGTAGTGPAWFEMRTKDGRILEFGHTSDSQILATGLATVSTWSVSKVSDLAGNYYTVSYWQNTATGEARPARIDYTGNGVGNLSPYNSVRFLYRVSDSNGPARSDAILSYRAGAAVSVRSLLTGVQTFSGSTLVSEYRLSYADGTNQQLDSARRSLLYSVQRCDSVGACLAPTIFTYGVQSGPLSSQAHSAGSPSLAGYAPYVAAFSGKGRDDVLWVMINPETGQPTGQFQVWTTNDLGWSFQQGPITSVGIAGDVEVYLGDFGGTGRIDILFRGRTATSGGGMADQWALFASNGDGTFTSKSNPFGNITTDPDAHPVIGDFFGNGVSSILMENTRTGYRFFLRNDGGYSFHGMGISGLSISGVTSYAADFNGDGLADLLLEQLNPTTGSPTGVRFVALNKGAISSTTWQFSSPSQNIQSQLSGTKFFIGDFNGDGLADLLLQGVASGVPNGLFATLLSKGDGSFAETDFHWQIQDYSSYYIAGVGRFSGTGLSDLLLEKMDVNGLSTGDRQIGVSKGDGSFDFRTASPGSTLVGYRPYVGDFVGGGKAGLLYVQAQVNAVGVPTSSASNGSVTVWPGGLFPCDTLSSVTTGLGAVTSTTLVPLYANGVYSVGSALPDYGSLRPPRETQMVVAGLKKSDGLGGTNSYEFHYTRGAVEPTGRGFLGFDGFSTTDKQTLITVSDTYTNYDESLGCPWDCPWQGMPSTSVVTIQTGASTQMLRTTTFSYKVQQTNSAGPRQPKSLFLELTAKHITSADLDGSSFPEWMASNVYDCDQALPCYGNVTESVSSLVDPASYSSKTINTYNSADKANWIVGQLAQSAVTNTLSGASATRTNAFTYQPSTGLLASAVVEPTSTTLRLENDYGRDSFGNINAVTTSGVNIATRTASTVWTSNGAFVSSTTNALNQSSLTSFDPRFGVLASITDPNGLAQTAQYDSFGRLALLSKPNGTGASYSYAYCSGVYNGTAICPALAAYLVRSTPVNASGVQIGPQTTQYFDVYDRVLQSDVQSFDGALSRVQTQYNALGRVAKVSEPFFVNGGAPIFTQYTYDALGRVTRAVRPDGSWDQRDYHGLTIVNSNSKSQTQTVIRNQLDQIASVKDTLGNTTSYSYDAFGNSISVNDPAGNITSYAYDLRGRVTSVSDPDVGLRTSVYDAADQLISQVDANGNTTTFGYDLLGRLISRIESGTTSTWTYDTQAKGIGKLATASTDGGYQRVQAYDSLGRPSQTTLTIDGVSYSSSTNYDSVGRLGSITYPSGFAVNYIYNSLGYLTSTQSAATNAALWTANSSDASLRLTQETFGNGIVTNRAFDASTGKLLSIGAGADNAVQNLSYAWDTVGNLTQRVDGTQELSETFTYDALNRLTNADIAGGASKTFSYDVIGNIISKSDVGIYSYPTSGPGAVRPHAVASVAGSVNIGVSAIANPSYSYDANGNLTSGGGRSFTYTAANLPSTVTAGSINLSFAYDSEHSRIKQTAPEGSTLYLNAGGAMAEKFTDTNGVVSSRNYLTVGSRIIGLHQEAASGNAQTLYFHKDHLNSVVALTDDSGNVLERNAYDAWGKRRHPNGSDDATNVITSRTTRGFIEQEHLGDVGLVHLNARIYDPQIGRFTTTDPIGLAGGANLYRYASNNPLSLVDPRGTDADELPGINVEAPDPFSGANSLLAGIANSANYIAEVLNSYSVHARGLWLDIGGQIVRVYGPQGYSNAIKSYNATRRSEGGYGEHAEGACSVSGCVDGKKAWSDFMASVAQMSQRERDEIFSPCQAECQTQQRAAAIAFQTSRSPAASASIARTNAELGAANPGIPGVGGNIQLASDSSIGFVDLTLYEGQASYSGVAYGHAIRDHVNKSEESLRQTVLGSRGQFLGIEYGERAEGSFPSLMAANKLVSATLAQNAFIVGTVASGQRGGAVVRGDFGSPTGYEAFATSARSEVGIRSTSQVTAVISYHPSYPGNIFILTAFPSNPQ
ncbi:RHS repeat-associated core domain-containing protein [Bradyrhizobium sp. INPA03-11B]|uniref:RHS repeat-associated core domain-containing protein n=1 Tax=Bradyrhizobium sp. INPA03-11B TaxID=418598 RepID=UPI00338E6186